GAELHKHIPLVLPPSSTFLAFLRLKITPNRPFVAPQHPPLTPPPYFIKVFRQSSANFPFDRRRPDPCRSLTRTFLKRKQFLRRQISAKRRISSRSRNIAPSTRRQLPTPRVIGPNRPKCLIGSSPIRRCSTGRFLTRSGSLEASSTSRTTVSTVISK